MSRVSISLKSAKALTLLVAAYGRGRYGAAERELSCGISRAERLRPGLKKAKARVAKKKRTKAKDTRSIRGEVMERSHGNCECGCGMPFTFTAPAQLDHFFGRVRAKQSISSTWMLRRECHHAKTLNQPSAQYWLHKFATHAEKHGYGEEFRMAARRLASLRLQEEAVAT